MPHDLPGLPVSVTLVLVAHDARQDGNGVLAKVAVAGALRRAMPGQHSCTGMARDTSSRYFARSSRQ